jgi:hypothetical protein
MSAKPMFSMLVWSYYVTGQPNFASNGHEAAMIASMASCACCQMHPRFAESIAQRCAEGEIANPLGDLPGGSESHGKRPETYAGNGNIVLVRVRPGHQEHFANAFSNLQVRLAIDPAPNLVSPIEIARISSPQRADVRVHLRIRNPHLRACAFSLT